MKTTLGLFEIFSHAEKAFNDLLEAGITPDQISVVTLEETVRSYLKDDINETAEGATTGALGGGLVGLLAGLGAITIPGIGPILTAGTIASVLASTGIGAGVGAAGGGLMGALMDEDVMETEAELYTTGVTQGGILLAVRAEDEQADIAYDLMKQAGAVDVKSRYGS